MAIISKLFLEGPPAPDDCHYRQYWLRELLIFAAIVLVSTLIFWCFPVDLAVSEWFRTANGGVNWPIAQQEPWNSLNHGGDKYLTILLVSLALLILGYNQLKCRCKKLRLYALFILASVILGPGLLINAGFKEHLGRPRPVEIENFGGHFEYVPPLHLGSAGGNSSFPSGHAASAFSFVVFWFIWRGRHPRLAVSALAGTLILGWMMSFSRIAVGAHFLSDVLWSGYLCYFSCFILYYFVLRLPGRQRRCDLAAAKATTKDGEERQLP